MYGVSSIVMLWVLFGQALRYCFIQVHMQNRMGIGGKHNTVVRQVWARLFLSPRGSFFSLLNFSSLRCIFALPSPLSVPLSPVSTSLFVEDTLLLGRDDQGCSSLSSPSARPLRLGAPMAGRYGARWRWWSGVGADKCGGQTVDLQANHGQHSRCRRYNLGLD